MFAVSSQFNPTLILATDLNDGIYGRMPRPKHYVSSSSILQAIEELGLAGVWSKNLLTGEENWSAGLCKIIGHQLANAPMSFDRFMERVHPDDRKWVSEFVSKEFHLLPSDAHVRVLQQSGILRWAHIRSHVLFSPEGEAVCMFFIAVDITDRQQSIGTLAQLDRRLEALAENFRATLFAFSPDGQKLQVHNWRKLGLPSGAAFSSMAFLEGVIPEDKERVQRHWTTSLAEKKATTIRHRRVSMVDGQVLDMTYFLAPIFEENGVLREWAGFAVQMAEAGSFPKSDVATTGAHVRCARALIDWSIEELANRSGVSVSTIRRIESDASLPSGSRSFLLIKQTLESSGVEFSRTASGATAVSLRS